MVNKIPESCNCAALGKMAPCSYCEGPYVEPEVLATLEHIDTTLNRVYDASIEWKIYHKHCIKRVNSGAIINVVLDDQNIRINYYNINADRNELIVSTFHVSLLDPKCFDELRFFNMEWKKTNGT